MVLAYDLLDHRCTIDVTIRKFFSLYFKMAVESFQNVDNILRGTAKYSLQKSLAETLNRIEKREEEK